MSSLVLSCRIVKVVTFRGDRSRAFSAKFQKKIIDERSGAGPGPSREECLLFAGHTGVSVEGDPSINGFNPDPEGIPIWELLDRLKGGEAFAGVVSDDSHVFGMAGNAGLTVLTFQVSLPEGSFRRFARRLDRERRRSQYSYGFPSGDGDCNCTTWLERMGLPLLTGRMDEFIALPGMTLYPTRRFGLCQ